MNLPYPSTRDLAAELKARHFSGLHVLPYDRFRIDSSRACWLSPESEKRAFQYGKLGCTIDENWVTPGNVFCGFAVERGLSTGLAPSLIMTPDWFWHRFVAVSGQPLEDKIADAQAAISTNLQIRVVCGVHDPSTKWDRVVLEVNGSSLTQLDHQRSDGQLDDLAAATSMADFSTALRALDKGSLDWHWAHIMIGLPFTMNSRGPDDLDTCAAMLKPFERWMLATV